MKRERVIELWLAGFVLVVSLIVVVVLLGTAAADGPPMSERTPLSFSPIHNLLPTNNVYTFGHLSVVGNKIKKNNFDVDLLCNEQDGCYTYGDGCEERDYYRAGNGTACNYTSSNRHTDGWVDTGNTRWIDENECQEKEQKEQEYRDYECSAGSCNYSLNDTKWVDTGNTSIKANGTICGCTANNTVKRCYDGNCTDTGIGNSSNCCADVACDGKELNCTCGDICVNTTGWWRDGGAFHPTDTPIQAAIDNATAGDTIIVYSGTYYENVVIDKSHLALIGEDRDTTIDGGGENYAICITADLVNISGFSVRHSRVGIIISSSNNNITNCNISNNSEGILLENTLNTITNCNIFNNDCHGLMIVSSENLITNCNISSNGQSESYLGHGIYFRGAAYNKIISCKSENNDDGICLVGSTNNQIINCDIHSNRLVGLKLVEGYHGASSNNQITDCSVRNNENGVYLFESYDNVLRGNSIWDNIYNFGVYARDTWRYNQDIDTSNTIEGKSIYYMVEEADITADGATSNVGYLGLISCDNIRVKNLKVSQNYQGLLLAGTTNSIIENCDLSNNMEGIHLFCSSHNNISNSNTLDNTCGIQFYGYGPSNAVTNCNILNNCNEGIYFDSNSGGGTVANCTILN
jgi:parallel beta-helix repeat protein